MEKNKKKIKIRMIFSAVFFIALITIGILYVISLPDPNAPILITIEPSEYYEALSLDDIFWLNGGKKAEIRRFGYGYRANEIQEIEGPFTSGVILTPEDAVKALTSVRDIMNIESFSYIYIANSPYSYINTHANRTAFYLKQVYNGVEVFNGQFTVYATNDGKPVRVSGMYINIVDLDTIPTVSSDEAKEVLNLNDGEWIYETKLVIYEFGKVDIRLCWIFNTNERFFLVDAQTGKLAKWGWTIIA